MQKPPETEAGFQDAVVELASLRGWLHFHDFDSRRNRAGFPDLVLSRRGRLIFAELKTETGRVSPDQQLWLDELAAAARNAQVGRNPTSPDAITVRLWRPHDWPEIEATLR